MAIKSKTPNPIWKPKIIQVPTCPKCGAELEIPKHPDIKVVCSYICNKCDYIK